MHLQGKRLRIIPKPPPQEEEVEEEELEEDELDEDEQMEEEDVANSNIGGNTENDKEKNQKIMVKHILSKRTRVRPRPGFQGENQVLSYRQTFNYMRDNMYRQQNQADLQYVKLNNKNRESDEIVVELANEDYLCNDDDNVKNDDGSHARNGFISPSNNTTNRHDRRIKNVYDEYDFKAQIPHQIANPEVLQESKFAINDDEDMEADKLNYTNWEDKILWGDDNDSDSYLDNHDNDNGNNNSNDNNNNNELNDKNSNNNNNNNESKNNMMMMDVDNDKKQKTNSKYSNGGSYSSTKNFLYNAKKLRSDAKFKTIRNTQRIPSIGMNANLKDKNWLNAVIWDDTDEHGMELCTRDIPIKLDYTDPALVFPLQSKKAIHFRTYAEKQWAKNKPGLHRSSMMRYSSIDRTVDIQEMMLRNKIQYLLTKSFPPSEMRHRRKYRDPKLKIPNNPISHSEAAKKHPKFGTEPTSYSVRSFTPLHLLSKKKEPWVRLKFGQPFSLPMEINHSITDHKSLFASSKDKGEMVLFEYLEEKPPLLNEIGMGAKIINYHMGKGGDGSSGNKKNSNSRKIHRIGHNVQINKTNNEDLYPLLGRKSLKENSTTKVLWTNLSRAKIKKQETPSCEFLVTIVGKKKVGERLRISKKAKIWPIPHTYAVGQQEVIADTSKSKAKAEVRKSYYKLQILKIMKERRDRYHRNKTSGWEKIHETELGKLLPLAHGYKGYYNTFILARRTILAGNAATKTLKPEYNDLEDAIEKLEKAIPIEEVAIHNALISEIIHAKSTSFLSHEFVPETSIREKQIDGRTTLSRLTNANAAATATNGSSSNSSTAATTTNTATSTTTTTTTTTNGRSTDANKKNAQLKLKRSQMPKGRKWVQEILDPEKGPLKILLNIQKRRRNRLRWLESERKKRAERGHGYYQVGLYDRRIETVEKALEIGRREINSIKTFVAILQTLPWKLQKNFQQSHVWLKRIDSSIQKLRLTGPGNPFGIEGAGFSYVIDEEEKAKSGHHGRAGHQTKTELMKLKMRQVNHILVNELGQDLDDIKTLKHKYAKVKLIEKLRIQRAIKEGTLDNSPSNYKERLTDIALKQDEILAGTFNHLNINEDDANNNNNNSFEGSNGRPSSSLSYTSSASSTPPTISARARKERLDRFSCHK